MGKFFGERLFAIVRDLVWAEVGSFVWRLVQKAGAWLDMKINGRAARIIVGLFLGFAAWGVFPLIVFLLHH